MFGPFPTNNTNSIQLDMLERAFLDSLNPVLAYRNIADQEDFPGKIGETLTKTKAGLMVPNITPLNPATNTNLDNGLTPTNYGTEQYTLSIAQYAQLAYPINLMDDERTIAKFFIRNTENLGIAQASAIDFLARNALYNSYMGGNTVVTATLGAPATTVQVNDVRGFQALMVNGNSVPVSIANPLEVEINGNTYNIVGHTVDVVNVSTALITGGISGTLTADANIAVLDGTAGNAILSINSPLIIRPNGRLSTSEIVSSDLLTFDAIQSAVTYLRNNNVMPSASSGLYHCYLEGTSMQQLFKDPAFQILYRGTTLENEVYKNAYISEGLGVKFYQTTQAPIQTPQPGAAVPVLQTIRRPILCGQGALVEPVFTTGVNAVRARGKIGNFSEGTFDNKSSWGLMTERAAQGGSYMYVRPPIDALGQVTTQTSSYIGGFTAPTDSLTNNTVIGTASNADFKRAVIIEHA